MVARPVLGTGVVRRVGSSPTSGTNPWAGELKIMVHVCFVCAGIPNGVPVFLWPYIWYTWATN